MKINGIEFGCVEVDVLEKLGIPDIETTVIVSIYQVPHTNRMWCKIRKLNDALTEFVSTFGGYTFEMDGPVPYNFQDSPSDNFPPSEYSQEVARYVPGKELVFVQELASE